ncbi:MAG: hypothetical protein FJ279_18895 [Planctomycetes bacterium]|nr:hypothetical protein [Planctomycetota bacterium]
MTGPAIVVDFDGTICEHQFPDVGPPKMGVKEALERFRQLGLRIIIHSVRTASYWREAAKQDPSLDPDRQAQLIRNYMAEHQLPFDEILMADKPLAIAYIDDNAIRFEDNWWEITQAIEQHVRVMGGAPQSNARRKT